MKQTASQESSCPKSTGSMMVTNSVMNDECNTLDDVDDDDECSRGREEEMDEWMCCEWCA